MTEYRDIGRLNNSASPNILTETPKSQVFRATHDKAGIRLPYRYRSFISFSYNGRWIEDFDLIATVDGERMSKGLTGQFEDLTATNSVTDGQYFNSTHYRGTTLSFSLATDGIDSRMIEDFINWFQPGQYHELILSEHPNRGIMARVAEPPIMEVLPFEKQIEMTMGGVTYTTSVTNFKGAISLTFIMDDPFWYSIINIFGDVDQSGNYVEEWDGIDYTGQSTQAKEKFKDILKIVYEDGIPTRQMIEAPMIFGNNIYSTSGDSWAGRVVEQISEGIYVSNNSNIGYYSNGLSVGLTTAYYRGAVAEDAANPTYSKGIVSGARVSRLDTISLSLPRNEYIYLYYAGTAPAPIQFTFTIPITVGESGYITSIASEIHPQSSTYQRTYNTITFECLEKQELRFTTPNFLTSYNKVMKLFRAIAVGTSWETLRSLIRDEIRHPTMRAMAISLINSIAPLTTVSTPKPTTTVIPEGQTIGIGELVAVTNNSGSGTSTGDELIIAPHYHIGEYDGGYETIVEMETIEDTDSFITQGHKDLLKLVWPSCVRGGSLTVTINSKTGEATGIFKYHYLQGKQASSGLVALKENVGDMFNSNYIKLKDRNIFTNDLRILAWNENSRKNSYRIYHNINGVTLTDVQIMYKNLYF